ncbi:MAG: helix-turn-helix transcriptional regulator [Oscillospiraceae bacterium]|nr:helix-turn-helix transcriptional regulator [Oscillospiraceae bacterium]
MEKQTMGSFMAVLRKARGMTQQEVADRLGVSNKAVSRWERDECAPDISLLPAIAELFGVSCDELLAGRPLNRREGAARPKVEKQRQALIRRALTRFQTMEAVSIGLAAAGLLCALALSYGFYRPVLGFFVMMLLQIAAVVLALIAGSRARAVREDNELLEQAEADLLDRFDQSVGNGVFTCLYSVLSAVLLSLPLLWLAASWGARAVIGWDTYLCCLAVGVPLLLLFFLPLRAWFAPRYMGQAKTKTPPDAPLRRRLRLQWGLRVLAGLRLFVGNGLSFGAERLSLALTILGLLALLGVVAVLVVFLVRHERRLLFSGVRNLLLIVPAGLLGTCCVPVLYSSTGGTEFVELTLLPLRLFWGLFLALIIPALFQNIHLLWKRTDRAP